MFGKEEIINQLENMGAPKNSIVIVHVSLRAVGEIEGGAQTLLDAMIEYFTAEGGVLCVPAHTWANFYEGNKVVLDENSSKTCVGKFCDISASDVRGRRTVSNPTHSLTLFGDKDKVDRLIKLEEQVKTPVSPKGCYGQIVEKGHVLLIGVGHDKNTIMHCVEEMMSVPNRLSNTTAFMTIKMKDGNSYKKEFAYFNEEDGVDPSNFFPKYEIAYRYHGAITDGFIGNAKAQLCNANIIKEVMFKINKRTNGEELLADDKPLKDVWYKD